MAPMWSAGILAPCVPTKSPDGCIGCRVMRQRGTLPHGFTTPATPRSPLAPAVSRTPGDVSLDQVEAILHDLVAGMAPDPVPARGRPRILPALALWSGLLVGILRGSSAIAGTWRLLSGAGLWWFPRFPISDQAVAKRIADDDGATIRTMFTAISSLLATRLAPLLPSPVSYTHLTLPTKRIV